MVSPRSFHPQAFTVATEISSLIEQGIDHIRQGCSVEGATFFARARERLSPDQVHLAAALDAIMQCQTRYSQMQQALLMASRYFVEADTEQQKQLVALETLMTDLSENTISIPLVLPPENAEKHQLLQSSQLLSTDAYATIRNEQSPLSLHLLPKDENALSELYITCFGHFEVRQSGKPVTLCSSRNGQSILRYIIARSGRCATSDALQALLWPEDEPEVAQRKLHIAISALRRSLSNSSSCTSECGYIVCKNHTYYLDPDSILQTDVDEFLSYYQKGQQKSDERIAFYEKACLLYTGPFLPEDIYADWSFLQREQLSNIHLDMCRVLSDHYLQVKYYDDAMKWASAILSENRCDEAAHQQLIRIYIAQSRRSAALQQYRRCERLLQDELGVRPLPETLALLQNLHSAPS